MKKLFIPMLLVSKIALADVSGVTQLDYWDWEKHPAKKNYPFQVDSRNEAHIVNTTNVNQHIALCYSIVACQEYPSHAKALNDCRYFDLAPGQVLNDRKHEMLTVNYDWTGRCNLFSQVEIHGWEHFVGQDRQRMKVE